MAKFFQFPVLREIFTQRRIETKQAFRQLKMISRAFGLCFLSYALAIIDYLTFEMDKSETVKLIQSLLAEIMLDIKNLCIIKLLSNVGNSLAE